MITISAVIPAYNAENHIARAIDSVLAQTRKVDEIIVVDDGSSDNTGQVVQAYGDKVTYIHQQNAGSGATRNAGINAATSEWIAFLDSDDEWLPKKIQMQTDLIERNPDISWAYSNWYVNYENDSFFTAILNEKKAAEILKGNEFFNNYLESQAGGLPTCTDVVIAKRQAIIQVGMFNPNLPLAQDVDLWLRIAYEFPKVGFISAPLAIYHRSTPMSNTKRFTDTSHICNIIDRHIKLSAEKNCFEKFQRCIFPMLHHWVLMLSKDHRNKEMRMLIKKYRQYLPVGYYLQKNIRALFPGPVGCYNKLMAKLKGRS